MDTKFGPNVPNKILLNAAKLQGYSSQIPLESFFGKVQVARKFFGTFHFLELAPIFCVPPKRFNEVIAAFIFTDKFVIANSFAMTRTLPFLQ